MVFNNAIATVGHGGPGSADGTRLMTLPRRMSVVTEGRRGDRRAGQRTGGAKAECP